MEKAQTRVSRGLGLRNTARARRPPAPEESASGAVCVQSLGGLNTVTQTMGLSAAAPSPLIMSQSA